MFKNKNKIQQLKNDGRFLPRSTCRRPWKLTSDVQKCVILSLRKMRRDQVCTSTVLQELLARDRGVIVESSCIRKLLHKKGYRWLNKSKKRRYNKDDREERVQFASWVDSMNQAELKKEVALCMDGTVLSMPPDDPEKRRVHCLSEETKVWRKPSEACNPDLCVDNKMKDQTPISRAIPVWGGLSAGGFEIVAQHPRKKLNTEDWVKEVEKGSLTGAIKKLGPVRKRGPWTVLCDNESFLSSRGSAEAHRDNKVALLHIPPRSPDLNPIERYWGWLKKTLRRRDLKDMKEKRPVLGKMAYAARIKRVCRGPASQPFAKKCFLSLKKVCK